MFCCFLPSRRSNDNKSNNEKKTLLRNGTTINYQTIFAIPYRHVIRDDKILLESSSVVEANVPNAYLLFNDLSPDQAYETTCFSFDDVDVATPVVFTTTTINPHFSFERLYQVDHVTAINPSNSIQMHPTRTTSSSLVAMARPFDEFLTNPTMPNSPLDVQSNNIITKTDQN